MNKFFYRVQNGDCLLSVCQKFSTSVSLIIEENLLEREIEEGDLLLVSVCDDIYFASVFDSYESISKKLNVNKLKLTEINKYPYIFFGLPVLLK